MLLKVLGVTLANKTLGLNLKKMDLALAFKKQSGKSIINSFMYLGSNLLALWFSVQYVGVALSNVVYFFAFPFTCTNMMFDKNVMSEWWKNMVANALIPVIDLVLLMIPLAVGSLAGTSSLPVSIVELLICCMVIPARTVLRQAMGVAGRTGMELAGLATLMGAGQMLGSMAHGAAHMVGGLANGIGSARADKKMADMYQDIADQNSDKNEDVAMGQEQGGFNQQNMGGAFGMSGMADTDSGADSLSMEEIDAKRSASIERSAEEKYADVNNFTNPEFRNLSAQKKADLYRERSKRTLAKSIGGASGQFVGDAVQ